MMILLKVMIIIFLVMLLNRTEGFHSKEEIRKKSKELYKHRDMFTPDYNYSKIKKKITWIDPIITNDASKLSAENKLTISNLENIFK